MPGGIGNRRIERQINVLWSWHKKVLVVFCVFVSCHISSIDVWIFDYFLTMWLVLPALTDTFDVTNHETSSKTFIFNKPIWQKLIIPSTHKNDLSIMLIASTYLLVWFCLCCHFLEICQTCDHQMALYYDSD